MEIFTGHYGTSGAPRRPNPRLFERADPVDRLFDPLDRNDL
jgi:hypothetical protein